MVTLKLKVWSVKVNFNLAISMTKQALSLLHFHSWLALLLLKRQRPAGMVEG